MDNLRIPNNGRLQVILPEFVWEYLERERIRLKCSTISQVVRETLIAGARNEEARNQVLASLNNITPEQIQKISRLSEYLK